MLDKGVIATRRNEFMARSSEVNIDITGKSAHAAKYQEGIDAMEIAARYLLDLYTMEQEELSAETYRLLRFGLLKSGTVRNVVSNAARMEGTLRAFQDETYQYMKKRMLELAKPVSYTHLSSHSGFNSINFTSPGSNSSGIFWKLSIMIS